MLYNISDEFTKISQTRGTIQNTSQCYSVEISDNAVTGNGFLLYPFRCVSFTGNIFARCAERGGHVRINVVSFVVNASGNSSGGGSYIDDSSVASDSDIDNLLDDIFGNDDTPHSAAPSVASDADIDSLIEDIFTNGVIFPDDTSPPTTDGVLVDDSQVASDEDIDDLINNIFG